MSHDDIWRAACLITISTARFHLETHKVARGVTDVGVGSGALFGVYRLNECHTSDSHQTAANDLGLELPVTAHSRSSPFSVSRQQRLATEAVRRAMLDRLT